VHCDRGGHASADEALVPAARDVRLVRDTGPAWAQRARRCHQVPERPLVYVHVQRLINEISPDEPDPAVANALQEALGGQFGETRTMTQYLFLSMNFRIPTAKPYRDLIQGVGTGVPGPASILL